MRHWLINAGRVFWILTMQKAHKIAASEAIGSQICRALGRMDRCLPRFCQPWQRGIGPPVESKLASVNIKNRLGLIFITKISTLTPSLTAVKMQPCQTREPQLQKKL